MPDELAWELRAHERYLVVGHIDPDGDCVASQLILHSILRRLGRESLLVNAGPFTRPEISGYAEQFASEVRPVDRAGDAAVVIVDCSTLERTGPLAESIRGLPTMVIDHHASGTHYGEVRLVDPSAPSVALMLLGVMDALGLEASREEAELILFGLCTDTAFFRHLDGRSAGVFTSVARLVGLGASPQTAYARIYGGRNLEERRLLGSTLQGTESHAGGRLLLCTQLQGGGVPQPSKGGSDELYRLLQTVAGVQVVVLVRQECGAEHSVGLRSTGPIDVGSVARRLGGGGHAPAAGCTLSGSAEEVRRRVLAELLPLFGA